MVVLLGPHANHRSRIRVALPLSHTETWTSPGSVPAGTLRQSVYPAEVPHPVAARLGLPGGTAMDRAMSAPASRTLVSAPGSVPGTSVPTIVAPGRLIP